MQANGSDRHAININGTSRTHPLTKFAEDTRCRCIALFQPEIAGNVGAVLPLGACLGAAGDLIEPGGSEWDDRRVGRTAMDYIDHVSVTHHAGFDPFKATTGSQRLALFTTKSSHRASWFEFMADDILLFGKESAGVPSAVAEVCEAQVRPPMRPRCAQSFSQCQKLALGEAMRQTASLPR